jgi:hypothetical protein
VKKENLVGQMENSGRGEKIMVSKKVTKKAVKKVAKKAVKKTAGSHRRKNISELAEKYNPRDAKTALSGVYDILKNEKRWVKNALFTNEDETEVSSAENADKACLLGTINAVNGPSESEVAVATAVAACELFPHRVRGANQNRFKEEFKDYLTNLDSEKIAGVEIYTDDLNFDSIIDDLHSWADDAIPEFNDDEDTTHEDVLKVIKRAKEILVIFDAIRSRFDIYREKITSLAMETKAVMDGIDSLIEGISPEKKEEPKKRK